MIIAIGELWNDVQREFMIGRAGRPRSHELRCYYETSVQPAYFGFIGLKNWNLSSFLRTLVFCLLVRTDLGMMSLLAL